MNCIICDKNIKENKSKTCSLICFNKAMKSGKADNGMSGRLHSDKSKAIMSEKKLGISISDSHKGNIRKAVNLNHPMKGKKHSNHTINLLSKKQIERWSKYSDKEREEIKQKLLEYGMKGGKSKWYEYKGIKIQGTYELFYILNLSDEEFNNIIPKRRWIGTPFGKYMPDFEFEENFVEIKSEYTLSAEQFKKIEWVSENVKEVLIIIYGQKEVEEFFKEIKLSKFIPRQSSY